MLYPNRSVKPMSEAKFTIERIKTSDVVNQKIKIDKSKGAVKATFQSFNIKDGEHFVTYIPSLNMTGYGATEAEGVEMLKEIMKDYFDALIKLPLSEIDTELNKFGWDQNHFFKKQFRNRTYVDKDGILKGFEMPKNTPIVENRLQVA